MRRNTMIITHFITKKRNKSIILILFCLSLSFIFFPGCWEELDDALKQIPTPASSEELISSPTSQKELLLSEIQSAQTVHDNSVESNTVGSYAAGSKAALQTEIDNANTVYNDPASTDSDYDTARSVLESALSDFDSLRIGDLDVVFVFDTTGSMGALLPIAKGYVSSTISDIQAKNIDTKFGLVKFNEFDSVFYAAGYSLPNGYEIVNNLTTNSTSVIANANALNAGAGGDPDEAHVAAMDGTANGISWTNGSDRIVILFTASNEHQNPSTEGGYPGPDLPTAMNSIAAVNIKPVGIFYYGGAVDENELMNFFLPLGGIVLQYSLYNADTIMNNYISWWY